MRTDFHFKRKSTHFDDDLFTVEMPSFSLSIYNAYECVRVWVCGRDRQTVKTKLSLQKYYFWNVLRNELRHTHRCRSAPNDKVVRIKLCWCRPNEKEWRKYDALYLCVSKFIKLLNINTSRFHHIVTHGSQTMSRLLYVTDVCYSVDVNLFFEIHTSHSCFCIFNLHGTLSIQCDTPSYFVHQMENSKLISDYFVGFVCSVVYFSHC